MPESASQEQRDWWRRSVKRLMEADRHDEDDFRYIMAGVEDMFSGMRDRSGIWDIDPAVIRKFLELIDRLLPGAIETDSVWIQAAEKMTLADVQRLIEQDRPEL
jgi:hypothetical protein